MFFHTKRRNKVKRQSKSGLPKYVTIDPQVRDFFPFKIRHDDVQTTSTVTMTTHHSVTTTTMTSLSRDDLINVRRQTSVETAKHRVTIKSEPKVANYVPETMKEPAEKSCDVIRKYPLPEKQFLYRREHLNPYYENFCRNNLPRRARTDIR